MKQSASRSGLISFVMLSLILSGCGIQLEVATPIPATPTSRAWAFLRQADSYYERIQAQPRITFSADGSKAEVGLFMEPDQQTLYVVQYKQIWIAAPYMVTWYGAVQSSARLRLSLYQRPHLEAPWVAYNSAETELTTESVPATQSDSIGAGFYGETTGKVYLRVEVGVVAYPPTGEIINQASTNEFGVVVLRDPGEVEPDAAAAKVAYGGELKVDQLFFDWRGWKGGPCALVEQAEGDPAHDNIALACRALGEGEVMNAVNAMVVALGSGENTTLIASLADQLGLIASSTGDFKNAAEVFESAVTAWEIEGSALALSSALHNLATAYYLAEDDRTWSTVTRLYELRSQFWDELGTRLTEANLAKIDENADALDGLRWNFEGMGMADYSEVVQLWAASIRRSEE